MRLLAAFGRRGAGHGGEQRSSNFVIAYLGDNSGKDADDDIVDEDVTEFNKEDASKGPPSANNREENGRGGRFPRSSMSLVDPQKGGKGRSRADPQKGGKGREFARATVSNRKSQSIEWNELGVAAQETANSIMASSGDMLEEAFHDVPPQRRCQYSVILVVVFFLVMVSALIVIDALWQGRDTAQLLPASERLFLHEISPQRLHMDLEQSANRSVVSWPPEDSMLTFQRLARLMAQGKPSIAETIFDLADEFANNVTSRNSTTQTEAMHAAGMASHTDNWHASGTTAAEATSTRATTLTTTTVLAPVQVTTVVEDDNQSLFCFIVARADEPQRSLVVAQLVREVGIFLCEQHIVFSDTAFVLGFLAGKVVQTHVVPTRLGPPPLPAFQGLPLSASIFAQVWKNIFSSGTFRRHKWTVKVDPESVFFPARLRMHLNDTWTLQQSLDRTSGLYLRNCMVGKPSSTLLLSSIEVFSSRAVEALARGHVRCTTTLANYSRLTENMFMQQCMNMLGVPYISDQALVYDAACGRDPSPCAAYIVAFHPFSTADQQQACIRQASGSDNSMHE